ncbi:electron transport complex subunit RsxC [Ferribacterium limneticum]|uniref:electron transport complex subunit RsxC n=1 Tax=Ferribacterium limneticum TaxID=76259 RepID=UPI001CFA2A07|nr:electron transport complex subunit RsxC [Ferribacterium limneticum]UCV27283.1 electron transport complex subunit RsxC [Ferribacterium limneticum]UCV31200.1 electron transport complex subunit RsxC [Ferribacterium limneticum]
MLMNLFKFKGGVKPPTNKTQSLGKPIAQAPIPSRLVVPLHQSIGGTPRPVVQAGDRVLKGQLIGEADGWISAAVHAPTSGTVLEVAMHVQPHPSGLDALCVVIEPDGKDEWIPRQPLDYKSLAPEQVRERLQQAGVVGLGGAVFPTHGKLTASKTVPMEEMVVNGAECEPFITCDDLLMRERAEEVVRGIGIFRDLLQPKKILIGIEDNKPEAAEAMRAAVKAVGETFEVVQVPTLYPAGGAKQLIRVLTGKEVPAAKRSTDLGVQCFNVATAYTAWRAIAHGEPVVSRLVTVTGNVAEPRNYEVLIGTPMDELLKLAQPKPDTDGIVMGGPMMGFLVPASSVPVVKATNCLIAHSDKLFPPKAPEMPCIRCGACAQACPHELQPFEMYWFSRAKNFGKTQEYNIFDCIECGCCSFVCPSRIPLVQYFRFAKSEIWAREREKNASEQAKARFEFKQLREEREKADKAEKLAKAAAAQAAKKAAEAAAEGSAQVAVETTAAPVAEAAPVDAAKEAKRATIEAAMARAKAQREAVQPKNTEHLAPDQQKAADEIEARRVAAHLIDAEPAAAPAPASEKPE